MRYLFFQEGKFGLFDDGLIFVKDIADRIGNVYIARINKYDKKLDAYFINYEDNKLGFLNKTKYLQGLKPGDEILVQMTKDTIGEKLPKFSSKISIRNKDIKYISNNGLSFEKGISRQDIRFFKEEFSFKNGHIYKDFFEKNKDERLEEIKEIENVIAYLNRESQFLPIPRLLYRNDRINYYIDKYKPDFIRTNDKLIYRSFKDNIKVFYDEDYDYNYDENLSFDLMEKDKKRIELPRGEILFVEKTEAMWVVDVNSSSNSNSREDFLAININALKKIHQLIFLKEMSGILIVDAISLDDYEPLISFTKEEFTEENIKFHGLSNLGLLEFTIRIDF